MALVIINQLEHRVFLDQLVDEVVGVELHVVDGVPHGLVNATIISTFLASLYTHHGKLAITVSSEASNLTLFPGLLIGLNSLKSETLLLVGELAILSESVEADDELLFEGLEGGELDRLPLLIILFELLA